MGSPPFSDHSDDDDDQREVQGHGVAVPAEAPAREWNDEITEERMGWRPFFIRALALLCAMSLSVGSHYGSYILGPLKSRLAREIGTSNTEFSLLIAAYNLNSTWTPLIGGLLASRLGTALSSIIATSIILLGQLILMVGDFMANVKLMAFGLFIFGLGISPLSVVQETIIVRFFASHGLGVSLALGLIAGKGASFVSARTSYPLSEAYGPHAPFVASACLAGLSFTANLLYLAGSSWFARGAGVELEAAEMSQETKRSVLGERMTEADALRKVALKRRVRFWDITKMGDVFWAYIAVNVLCGAIWSPFTHLAANILEQRYNLTEAEASNQASLLLAGSIFLYPICGYLTDRLKKGPVVHYLFILSSVLTLFCYVWLFVPPSWTKTPLPAVLSFGTGHGFSTLLLVIIVPHLVPIRYVSTALGVHKSIEQSGSTISQTFAGLLLDKKRKKAPAFDAETPDNDNWSIQYLLTIFLFINVLQLLGTILLWRLDARQKRRASRRISVVEYQPIASTADDEDQPDTHGVVHDKPVTIDTLPESAVDEEESESDGMKPGSPGQGRRLGRHLDGSWSRGTRPLLARSRSISSSPTRSRPPSSAHPARYLLEPTRLKSREGLARTSRERRRGKVFAAMAGSLIITAWVLFMGTAWLRMRRTERKQGESS